MLRFLIAGVASFLTDVLLFALFLHVAPVALANAVSLALASAFNYSLHVSWVFPTEASKLVTGRRYVFSLVASYCLSTAGVLALSASGLSEVVAKFLVGGALAPLAFLAGKLWVYAR